MLIVESGEELRFKVVPRSAAAFAVFLRIFSQLCW
jgi:hypothetical protein